MSEDEQLKIGVVGGGLMGHGIAYLFAAAGHQVGVFEPSPDVRASMRGHAEDARACGNGRPSKPRLSARGCYAFSPSRQSRAEKVRPKLPAPGLHRAPPPFELDLPRAAKKSGHRREASRRFGCNRLPFFLTPLKAR